MRRYLLIISSVLFLNCTSELHQLFRIPLLFRHFRDHQAEDPSISFSGFLKLHYTGHHPQDNDDEEDNQLPFKYPGNTQHTDTLPPFAKEANENLVIYSFIVNTTLYPEGNLCKRSFSIFHPPRYS
ncbi:MAG: hypothetical protein J0L56_05500 [Chitinophagales bacterium]|nr:hypothetical protein [Chitinophagales bacterium]